MSKISVSPRFRFLSKISIFRQNLDFWPRFQAKISIFDFWPKFRFLAQILGQNLDFWPRFQAKIWIFDFWPKFRFFIEISILRPNLDFSPKNSKILFLMEFSTAYQYFYFVGRSISGKKLSFCKNFDFWCQFRFCINFNTMKGKFWNKNIFRHIDNFRHNRVSLHFLIENRIHKIS